MSVALDAAVVVTNCLRTVEPHERSDMLRELLTHSAASLEVIEGTHAAAEAIYRLGDAVVSREPSER